MSDRANPFANLGDFEVKTAKRPIAAATIEKIADESGFPSRTSRRSTEAISTDPPVLRPRRRYTTGRNRQINIKATSDTIERLYALADERDVPLGALLEEAVEALERQNK